MAVDSYSKEQMIALGITFLILPCIFVALRFWAKWLSRKALQWDDLFILLALVSRCDPCRCEIGSQCMHSHRIWYAGFLDRVLYHAVNRYLPFTGQGHPDTDALD